MRQRPLALNTTRRNEPANQILESNDSAEIFLLVNDNGKAKPGSAQLLDNAVGGFLLRSGYNTANIIAQRPVSVLIQQDVENVDQSSRLIFRPKHRKAIETGSGAQLQRLLS